MWFSDADAIREILVDTQKFVKYGPIYGVQKVFIGHSMVTTTVLTGKIIHQINHQDREFHKKHRKLVTPLFFYGSLKKMICAVNQYTIKSIVPELYQYDGFITNEDVAGWTMRLIIALAFRNSLPEKWLIRKFPEFLCTCFYPGLN